MFLEDKLLTVILYTGKSLVEAEEKHLNSFAYQWMKKPLFY